VVGRLRCWLYAAGENISCVIGAGRKLAAGWPGSIKITVSAITFISPVVAVEDRACIIGMHLLDANAKFAHGFGNRQHANATTNR
jgi:hypothetical protein